MRMNIKAVLATAFVVAIVPPGFSYEQSESPENNGRNIQQVQPGPGLPLTQLLQVRPPRVSVRSKSTEEQYFERAVGNLW